jgi:hypothetical protein
MRIMMSITYCVVGLFFVFFLSSSCVLCMVVSSTYCVVYFVLFVYVLCFVYGGVKHIWCCVFCFVCLRLVSCIPNVAIFFLIVYSWLVSLTFISHVCLLYVPAKTPDMYTMPVLRQPWIISKGIPTTIWTSTLNIKCTHLQIYIYILCTQT